MYMYMYIFTPIVLYEYIHMISLLFMELTLNKNCKLEEYL